MLSQPSSCRPGSPVTQPAPRDPPTHHVPGIGHEEVLCDVGGQEVEEDPLVVQLYSLHVIPLLFSLGVTGS